MTSKGLQPLDSTLQAVTPEQPLTAQPPVTSGRTRAEPARKADQWTENIHLRKYHDDSETANRLVANNLLTSRDDKYIDFILHIDNQKRTTVNN
jgi:hypothetical protein